MFRRFPLQNADGAQNEAGTQSPAPEAAPAPAAPAPANDLEARLAMLEQQNLQLQQTLMAQQLARQQAQAPQEEQIDLTTLDPTTQKYVQSITRTMERRLAAVQEQADQQAFLAEARANGIEQSIVQEAIQQHNAWRQAGATIVVGGEQKALSRFDALDFVLGRKQRAGLLNAAPQRTIDQVTRQVQAALGSARPAGAPANQMTEIDYSALEALPIDQQLKVLEERINKAGGFSALP